MSKCMLAVSQGPKEPGDLIGYIAEIARKAAAGGADVLLTPEMSATGYLLPPEQLRELASEPEGRWFEQIAPIARENGIAIVYGYPEKAAEGVYNSAAFVGADGRLVGNYRKAHLFGELDRERFVAGDQPPTVVEYNGLNFGMAICYDIEFPETARSAKLRGADILLVPTGMMKPFGHLPRVFIPARALENQMFVAYANRVGAEEPAEFSGRSVVANPLGEVACQFAEGEDFAVVELDMALHETAISGNNYLDDRRPEIYVR